MLHTSFGTPCIQYKNSLTSVLALNTADSLSQPQPWVDVEGFPLLYLRHLLLCFYYTTSFIIFRVNLARFCGKSSLFKQGDLPIWHP